MKSRELLRADYLKLLTDAGLEIPAPNAREAMIDKLRAEFLQDHIYGEEETRKRLKFLSVMSRGAVVPGSDEELDIIGLSVRILIV